MCGRATLAMEVSSTSMKVASVTVRATAHGLWRGFQTAGSGCGHGRGCHISLLI